jgi:aspartyl-tRNA(Asn)/glutamyl-tRNA(Gln) amidotransferase subunit A
MYDRILERVRGGGSVLAVDYIAGWEELRAIRARYLAASAGYDAVICPSAACLPPKVQRIAEDADYYRAINLKTLRNTRMGNLMGLTSASLPTGTPSCGVMLNAAPGHDARLLRLAHAAEKALA